MIKALSVDQEKQLVVDHEDGFTIKALADRHGVSQSTVHRTLARQGVKHKHRTRKHRAKPKSNPRRLKPCGTEAAYRRHKRHDEYPCIQCLEAHNTYEKERTTCSSL